MMPFYFRSGQKNHGPFEIDQLKDKITPVTLVWSPGMHEWVNTKNVDALSCLFEPSKASSQREESTSSKNKDSRISVINTIEKGSELDDQRESKAVFNNPKLNKESTINTNAMNLSNESSNSNSSNYAEQVNYNEIDNSFLNGVETELKKMIPWIKFYGIVQISITIFFLLSVVGSWNNSKKFDELFATLVVLAIFSFIPSIIILNVSKNSKKFSISKSQEDLFETIKTTSNYFRYLGVCMIIAVILSVIGVALATSALL